MICDHILLIHFKPEFGQNSTERDVANGVMGHSSQCSTTGVTKAVVYIILFVGWYS